MERDFAAKLEAMARINTSLEIEHLRSLTIEKAAAELEDLLELEAEIHRSGKEAGLPPPLPNPPPGPDLAIFLSLGRKKA
jgi:hypothetical protein